MSSTPLDPSEVAKLLKEEAERPTTRGPRTDPTLDRSLNAYFKLNHHICTRDCKHRVDLMNPTANPVKDEESGLITQIEPGNACWNPNCEDTVRDKDNDRGAQIVVEVKGQRICRYCYLAGYLL